MAGHWLCHPAITMNLTEFPFLHLSRLAFSDQLKRSSCVILFLSFRISKDLSEKVFAKYEEEKKASAEVSDAGNQVSEPFR